MILGPNFQIVVSNSVFFWPKVKTNQCQQCYWGCHHCYQSSSIEYVTTEIAIENVIGS